MIRQTNIISYLRGNKKIDLLFIALLFITVNGFTYTLNGIRVVNDSSRYWEYAVSLANGFYIDPFNIWYIGYSGYILLLNTITIKLYGVVLGQYILSFTAVLALYFTSMKLWKQRSAALFSVSLFLLFFDISAWNSYILAESLFTSFICLSLICVVKVYKKEEGAWFVGIMLLIVLFTFSIKPTGVALIGALLLVTIYQLLVKIKIRAISVGLVILITFSLLILLDQMLKNYLILENYKLGEVIYAVTEAGEKYDISYLLIDVPNNLYQPVANSSLIKIVLFALHHPFYWSKLFLYKIFFLFVHVRPYWSGYHNIFSLAFLVPSYYLFARGIAYKWQQELLPFIFAVTYILFHTLSIGLTSNDWDGRFLIPILPVIFLFSGKGLTVLMMSYKDGNKVTAIANREREREYK